VAIGFLILASVVSVLFVRSHVQPVSVSPNGDVAEGAVVGH
jgi:hypothetical protein